MIDIEYAKKTNLFGQCQICVKKIKVEMDKYQHQISQEVERKFDVKFTQIVC